MREELINMIDVSGPEVTEVEITIGKDGGSVLWVNIDGICRLRVQRSGQLVISDMRVRDEK